MPSTDRTPSAGDTPDPWANRGDALARWERRTSGDAAAGTRSGPPRWARLWLPVVLSFLVQVIPALVVTGRARLPIDIAVPIVALALVGPLALIGARRFPGPVVAIATAATAADLLFTPGSGAPYLALAFAVISATVRGARRWAFASIAAGWVVVLVGSATLGVPWHPGRVLLTALGIIVVMLIGEAVRTRGERVAAFQAASKKRREDAAAAERVRIARELHDVLAHSLSQINVQAGMGLHLIDSQPDKAREALGNIKATSKTALDEVRGVLGFLRSEGSVGWGAEENPSEAALVPQADLSRLPSLVKSISTDELSVALHNRLTSEPPPGVQLALYRIAQESLTNVVRHSAATSAEVLLVEHPSDYVLAVTDNGTSTQHRAGTPETSGRGMLGMRERAELLGGHLDAGPTSGGGFSVVATLPRRSGQ
ncbi:sensor histidine kinase [Subtercola frigoramans]|uniref:histidine kinase n=1 Tax=Subtercola frigoramans TaxID=120298 RepID=A0ABS2L4Y8_9MICO|nr:sensor histidine kinase [Subtercola frigoramans]MBM7471966.1 signal transduction histidine kinase [Subtercola frigoramans]